MKMHSRDIYIQVTQEFFFTSFFENVQNSCITGAQKLYFFIEVYSIK